jgi:hypothetical protein
MVTKINPTFDVTLPRAFNGKSMVELSIDLGVDASGSNGPDEAISKVLQVLSGTATIIAHSALTGTGELMTVFVEGDFPTDTYDGENNETYVTFLTSEIVALGTVDAIDLTGAVVTAGVVYQADQTNT